MMHTYPNATITHHSIQKQRTAKELSMGSFQVAMYTHHKSVFTPLVCYIKNKPQGERMLLMPIPV